MPNIDAAVFIVFKDASGEFASVRCIVDTNGLSEDSFADRPSLQRFAAVAARQLRFHLPVAQQPPAGGALPPGIDAGRPVRTRTPMSRYTVRSNGDPAPGATLTYEDQFGPEAQARRRATNEKRNATRKKKQEEKFEKEVMEEAAKRIHNLV